MSNKLCECSVPFCSDHELAASIGVPFHRFPTDDATRQQWLMAIHSDQLPVSLSLYQLSRKRVCGKHFKPSDYQVDIKHQVAPHIYPQKHLLKTTAVPSIFTSRETSKTPRNIWTQSVINNRIVKKKKNLSTNVKSGIINSKKSSPSSTNHQRSTCPQPMYMFHNTSSLNSEVTTYHQCHLCDELFLKPTDLQIHQKIHFKIEVDKEDVEFFRKSNNPETYDEDEDLSDIHNSDCQSEMWHTDLVKYKYLETNNNKTDNSMELTGTQNSECQNGTNLIDDCNHSYHVKIKEDLYAEPCSVPNNNRNVKTEIDEDIAYPEPTLNTAIHVKTEIDKDITYHEPTLNTAIHVKTEIDKDITYPEPTLNTAIHVKTENHQFDINSSEEEVPLTCTGMDYNDTDTETEMCEADVQETPLDVQGGDPNTNVKFRTSNFPRNESDNSNTCDKIENISSNNNQLFLKDEIIEKFNKTDAKQKIDNNDVLETVVSLLQAGKSFEAGKHFEDGKTFAVGDGFEAGICIDDNLKKHAKADVQETPPDVQGDGFEAGGDGFEAGICIDDSLKEHAKILCDEHIPCKCDVCDKIFLNTRKLELHQKIHFGKKKCHMCRKTFPPADLLDHARMHAEKPYKCNVCDQLFTNSIHLKHHTKIHNFDAFLPSFLW